MDLYQSPTSSPGLPGSSNQAGPPTSFQFSAVRRESFSADREVRARRASTPRTENVDLAGCRCFWASTATTTHSPGCQWLSVLVGWRCRAAVFMIGKQVASNPPESFRLSIPCALRARFKGSPTGQRMPSVVRQAEPSRKTRSGHGNSAIPSGRHDGEPPCESHRFAQVCS